MRRCAVLASLSLPLLLAGCALTNTASPVEEQGLPIQGRVHGGQQPVVGAHVYLLAANTTGYPTATTGASKSIMKYVNGVTGIDISSGPTSGFYYVTTDANGNFSIGGDYTCTSGQQVYLYVVGGDPGAGTPNSAAAFIAALGNCPSTGNFASAVPFIWVNEVTTVAAAYSMSAFAYDALHVSSPNSTTGKTNIRNAFANAGNIVDMSTGTPYGVGALPNGGNGAPNSIDTVANVLAACVNTTGPSSTPCSTLFALAKTTGSVGTAPTDTASAAINIAHNQALNVAGLYSIVGPTPAFSPSYAAAPADFAIPISFQSSVVGGVGALAIDASGNIWVATSIATSHPGSVNGIAEFSPQGALLANTGTPSMTTPATDLAIRTDGTILVANGGSSKIFYYDSNASSWNSYSATPYAPVEVAEGPDGSNNYVDNGSSIQPALNGTNTAGTGAAASRGLLVDGNGNFWSVNSNSSTFTKWNSSDALVSGSGAGFPITPGTPGGFAVDASNNIWVAINNNSSAQLAEYSNAGLLLNTFSDPNMTTGGGVVIDGGGNIWLNGGGGSDGFAEFDSQGNFLQGFGRFGGTATSAHRYAFDGSGNLWTVSASGVYQYLGIGTPVVTPIAANLFSPYTAPVNKPQ